MGDLQIKAILAGLFFGIYPLLLNRSGAHGNVAAAAFSLIVLISVTPFALASGITSLASASGWILIAAGLLGAGGMLSMNAMLAGATPQEVGALFALMTVEQVVIAGAYQTYMAGQLAPDKAVGFVGAIIVAWLLLR